MEKHLKAWIDILANVQQAKAQLREFKKEILGITEAQKTATAATKRDTAAVTKQKTAREALRKNLMQMRFLLLDVARYMRFVAIAAAGMLTALTAGMATMMKTAIEARSHWEQATLTFTALLQNAEKAKVLMQDLRKFALRSPFDLRETVDATKVLLAFGEALDDVRGRQGDLLDTWVKHAFVMGKSLEQMIRAVEKFKRGGVFISREMAPLGITRSLIEGTLGIPWDEAKNKPALPGGEVVARLTDYWRQAYAGIDYEQMTAVLLSNIRDAWYKFWQELGGAMESWMKPVLQRWMEFVNKLGDMLQLPQIRDAISSGLEALVGGPLRAFLDAIEQLASKLEKKPHLITDWLNALTAAIKGLVTVLITAGAAALILNFAHALGSLIALMLTPGWVGIATAIVAALGTGGLLGVMALVNDQMNKWAGTSETLTDKLERLRKTIMDWGDAQAAAKEKMREAKERLEELKKGLDDGTTSQEDLTQAQADFAGAAAEYEAALRGEASALEDYSAALENAATLTGALADAEGRLQALRQRGAPVTPEQLGVLAEHELARRVGYKERLIAEAEGQRQGIGTGRATKELFERYGIEMPGVLDQAWNPNAWNQAYTELGYAIAHERGLIQRDEEWQVRRRERTTRWQLQGREAGAGITGAGAGVGRAPAGPGYDREAIVGEIVGIAQGFGPEAANAAAKAYTGLADNTCAAAMRQYLIRMGFKNVPDFRWTSDVVKWLESIGAERITAAEAGAGDILFWKDQNEIKMPDHVAMATGAWAGGLIPYIDQRQQGKVGAGRLGFGYRIPTAAYAGALGGFETPPPVVEEELSEYQQLVQDLNDRIAESILHFDRMNEVFGTIGLEERAASLETELSGMLDEAIKGGVALTDLANIGALFNAAIASAQASVDEFARQMRETAINLKLAQIDLDLKETMARSLLFAPTDEKGRARASAEALLQKQDEIRRAIEEAEPERDRALLQALDEQFWDIANALGEMSIQLGEQAPKLAEAIREQGQWEIEQYDKAGLGAKVPDLTDATIENTSALMSATSAIWQLINALGALPGMIQNLAANAAAGISETAAEIAGGGVDSVRTKMRAGRPYVYAALKGKTRTGVQTIGGVEAGLFAGSQMANAGVSPCGPGG